MRYIFFLSLLTILSCTSNKQKGEELPQYTADEMENDLSLCDTKIDPFFTQQDTNIVKQYSFERYTSYTLEKITFENGLQLEINRAGCKVDKQRYQFTIPTKIEEDDKASFWVNLAAFQFRYLQDVAIPESDAQKIFYTHGEILKSVIDMLPLGQIVPVMEDATYKIDRFVNENSTIVVLEFELSA